MRGRSAGLALIYLFMSLAAMAQVTVSGNVAFTGNNTHSGTETYTGSVTDCIVNGVYIAGSSCYPTIQSAVNAAGTSGSVVIPTTYTGTDSYTNNSNIDVADYRYNIPDPFFSSAIRLNAGGVAAVGSSRPFTDSSGHSLPLGSDVGMVATGPADNRQLNELLLATSTTGVAGPGTQNITITTPCNYGAGCNANYFYVGASLDINRYQADYENVAPGNWSIVNNTTLSATFAKAHTQPFTVGQQGSHLIFSPNLILWDFIGTGPTGNGIPTFLVGQTGTNAAQREFVIEHGNSGVNYFKSGMNGNHLPRWYGLQGSGLIIYGSQLGSCRGTVSNCASGAGTSGLISFSTNETDDPNGALSKVVIDPGMGAITLNGLSITSIVAHGTATMTTVLIAAGACGTAVTVAASGVTTADSISWSFSGSVGANPGVLIVQQWPTANNVNFEYCNPTAAGVTPSAATLNWRVVR